jgi:hypothetical protein
MRNIRLFLKKHSAAAVAFAIPASLIGMMIFSRLGTIFVGPVNVWNLTWKEPTAKELAGEYRLSDIHGLRVPANFNATQAGFRLSEDYGAEVFALPAFSPNGNSVTCLQS